MDVNDLADRLEEFYSGTHIQKAAETLRQQANRIAALEQKQKDAFDYIEKLLKERQL